MNQNILVEHARSVMEKTYSPYSKFPVGAALMVNDGTIFVGTNVENASFGATICAERSAVVSAVSAGYQPGDFKEIAVISHMNNVTPPCALCRQVLVEFFPPQALIHMTSYSGKIKTVTLDALVPYAFGEDDLGDVNV